VYGWLTAWIGSCELCRDTGYSRGVIIDGRGYCIRAVDGRVDGRLIQDVREQIKGVAEWE